MDSRVEGERKMKGLLNISCPDSINTPGKTTNISEREGSKKSVQQGRSPFDARSVLLVREHGKRARTTLVAFSNIPMKIKRIEDSEA